MNDHTVNEHRRPTSHDVARLAGVSRSAVSRCFTPGASIADETRAKIMTAAAELGYRTNALARNLKSQQSQLVAILASRLDTPFRARQVKYLSRALIAQGFRPLLLTAERSDDLEPLLSSMLDYNLAGMIVTSDTPPTAVIEECKRLRVPLVLINRNPEPNGGDRIELDTTAAAEVVFDILYQAGARRFAVLRPEDRTYTVMGRVHAFDALVRAKGMTCHQLPCDSQSYGAGRDAMRQYADILQTCDGLFATSDLLACGALDGLRLDLNMQVPKDIHVVGFDDIEQASWASYDLSTVRQDPEKQAGTAVEVMLYRLQMPDAPTLLKHPPLKPILRGTTGKPDFT
ncbi:LacI family DNA-binding transcriptional regulator [Pacificibacter marinus]|uniref:LacI family DNA-binding transcriptional regulator n=1 Tax=Pacificibacter marinus TaxID=658057 RepID=UPI001C07A53E|nr:LacI family DNA-binding transcriptional regulator [Pacificibacter marinus]MBU2866405.1 LacI family DNA-binding transcriptional regulator [Pacificibacter marinus]